VDPTSLLQGRYRCPPRARITAAWWRFNQFAPRPRGEALGEATTLRLLAARRRVLNLRDRGARSCASRDSSRCCATSPAERLKLPLPSPSLTPEPRTILQPPPSVHWSCPVLAELARAASRDRTQVRRAFSALEPTAMFFEAASRGKKSTAHKRSAADACSARAHCNPVCRVQNPNAHDRRRVMSHAIQCPAVVAATPLQCAWSGRLPFDMHPIGHS